MAARISRTGASRSWCLPGLRHGATVGASVEITQIAPTILQLLGLNPRSLQAVQIEGTRVLPGL